MWPNVKQQGKRKWTNSSAVFLQVENSTECGFYITTVNVSLRAIMLLTSHAGEVITFFEITVFSFVFSQCSWKYGVLLVTLTLHTNFLEKKERLLTGVLSFLRFFFSPPCNRTRCSFLWALPVILWITCRQTGKFIQKSFSSPLKKLFVCLEQMLFVAARFMFFFGFFSSLPLLTPPLVLPAKTSPHYLECFKP